MNESASSIFLKLQILYALDESKCEKGPAKPVLKGAGSFNCKQTFCVGQPACMRDLFTNRCVLQNGGP